MAGKNEGDFKAETIDRIEKIFPGCIVTKLDASLKGGIPDVLILYGDKWATLEFKRSAKANRRPNQEYYVNLMNDMSFSRFIFPENVEEVLDDLQQALRP